MADHVDYLGVERRLGNIDAPIKLKWGVYGSVPETPMVPEDQWEQYCVEDPFADNDLLPYIHDQDGIGQCNADATTALAEYCQRVEGIDVIDPLCAADLYHRINGGADNGSLLEDAIREMMARGVGKVSQCGNTNLWKGSFRPATDAQRAENKILEAWLCPTFAHCMSAVIKGFGMVTGIMWPSNDRLDSDGWLQQGSQGGGHAIFGHTPVCRKRSNGIQYGIGHNNSWTPQWGRRGKFVIGREHYGRAIGGWWAARSITIGDRGIITPNP